MQYLSGDAIGQSMFKLSFYILTHFDTQICQICKYNHENTWCLGVSSARSVLYLSIQQCAQVEKPTCINTPY